MTNTPTLEKQMKELVQHYVAQARQAAMDAVERAFATAMTAPISPTVAKRQTTVKRSRRTPEEIVMLRNKFYDAVCGHPGETMKELSQKAGVPADSLQLPVIQLKRDGKIRTVGQRQFTRYFPCVANEQAA